MNPLKKRIGILGGGQLGRMLIEESLRLNLHINILESDTDCPCAGICDHFIQGSLQDETAIRALAAESDVLTFEIEHVNTNALLALEAEGKEVIPSPALLRVIQDKGLQKQFFKDNGLPTSSFVLVQNASEWGEALKQLPGDKFAAKTRKDGYDGKGVSLCSKAEIEATRKVPFDVPCVLEAFVEAQKELSVIVARDRAGHMLTYPVVEMEFDPIANLVTFLFCPANISAEIAKSAEAISAKAIEALKGVGVFAVELFLTSDGEILINEIAPRVHNSGHHTIEANYTSQFEQLSRILCGLPLGSTALVQPAIMINLLGGAGFEGAYKLQGLEEVSAMEGVYVHLYGKKTSKPKRKMGHVTVISSSAEEAYQKALKVKEALQFVAG